MSTIWSERQRAAWRAFLDAVQLRATREAEVRSGHQQRSDEIEQQWRDGRAKAESDRQTAVDDWQRKKDDTIETLRAKYDGALDKSKGEYQGAKQAALDAYQASRDQLEADFKESRWTIGTIREADTKNSHDQHQQQQIDAGNQLGKIEANRKKAIEVLAGWKLEVDDQSPPPSPVKIPDAWKALQQHVDSSAAILVEMQNYGLPKHVIGARPFIYMAVAWVLLCALSLVVSPWWLMIAVASALVLPGGMIARSILLKKMEAHAEELWLRMEQALADAKVGKQNAIDQAKRDWHERAKGIKAAHENALAELNEKTKAEQETHRQDREAATVAAQRKFEPYLKKLADERETKLRQALVHFDKQHVEVIAQCDAADKAVEDHHAASVTEESERHSREWQELHDTWEASWNAFRDEMSAIATDAARYYPQTLDQFPNVADVPLGLPLGRLVVNADNVPNLMPEDERLAKPDLDALDFRAMLPFPEKSSVLFQTEEEGRHAGVKAMESLFLRIWSGLPAGRARCTIIDPVGRGENFSASMHLGDKDANLVNSRIWTETKQIEDVLTDLTGQMETILQRFLRNQYRTLAEYNEQAGEVAEPFRFLFVANFPVNFTPDSAQRVISLATSGARCGIYTFVLVDTRHAMPHGINLEDLEKACTTLVWRDGRYVWQDDLFGKYPLRLEAPPAEEVSTRLYTDIGDKAIKALRVEVPFTSISPVFEKWWEQDAAVGIDVPIGKAGARRLQHLLLGKGTSQHVLVAGKTGSGKSTLLHVLIMQLAVRYSPDQVQLYLIDFKKGVEFKTYATSGLPHCIVVAIESEREFGLSVLQRIDVELTRRGDLFRTLGVNDLPSYRKYRDRATPEEREKLLPLPRQLLIIDEFQEFFVEDDKVSQEASLLMDRVVRQGRAFGIHLLMGSQTIGGAYSLARTTIDQMAVRIALQCSEADAHLILSRENTEARLLGRPGEAIYNASNGAIEGNNFFQIVWISDEQRDQFLKQMAASATRTGWKKRDPMIVFEGNLPADPRKNPYLDPKRPGQKGEHNVFRAFLGDAVAIKDPTCAVFRKQSGSNLMLVGQAEELAFNILTTAALSVSRDHPEAQIDFCVGAAIEPPQQASLGKLADVAPVTILEGRELNPRLKAIAKEVDERLKGGGSKQPIFLMLFGIQRLRDLRKPDDDFGFGKKGEEEKPHQLFARIIREGPPLGVYTLFWCDNLTNLQRFLDRGGMREFEMRILFQMNANDSSNLMDSPVAARLGAQRAFFYSEDQGKMEKFRPYGLLTTEYLEAFPARQAPANGQPAGDGSAAAAPAPAPGA